MMSDDKYNSDYFESSSGDDNIDPDLNGIIQEHNQYFEPTQDQSMNKCRLKNDQDDDTEVEIIIELNQSNDDKGLTRNEELACKKMVKKSLFTCHLARLVYFNQIVKCDQYVDQLTAILAPDGGFTVNSASPDVLMQLSEKGLKALSATLKRSFNVIKASSNDPSPYLLLDGILRKTISELQFVVIYMKIVVAWVQFPCARLCYRIPNANPLKIPAVELWIELYDQDKDVWHCYDCINEKYDGYETLGKSLSSNRCLYVFAIDTFNCIYDVTLRYNARILNVDKSYRLPALFIHCAINEGSQESRSRHENMVYARLVDNIKANTRQPLALKYYLSHPNYILENKLTKQQAVDPKFRKHIPVGYVNGIKILKKDWIVNLKSEWSWRRQGKIIRADQPHQELYGYWQTTDYVPPAIQDFQMGVPKTKYNSLEIYNSHMVPKHCRHLNAPKIGKLAASLHIDHTRALVDFSFNTGTKTNTPKYDGIIVLAKDADLLFLKWIEMMEKKTENDLKSTREHVRGLWKRLSHALLTKKAIYDRYLTQ